MSEIVDCIAYVVKKVFISFYIFFKFLSLRLLDLFGLIFNILACCTIIRFPFMIAQFNVMEDLWDWRFMGLIQLAIFISDIPIIIMGLVILFTFWRVIPCYKDLSSEWTGKWVHGGIYYTGFNIRSVIIIHFFTLFIDAFCIPSAIVCLLSWRSVIFIRKIRDAENDWTRREICFVQFFQVLLDIPLLICFVPVIFSWRFPVLISEIQKHLEEGNKWNTIRFTGIIQLFYLFIDIPCVIALLITLLTWRCPVIIWHLMDVDAKSILTLKTQNKIRLIALYQFLYIFLDIPAIFFAIFVICTLFRVHSLFKKCQKILKNDVEKKEFYKKECDMRTECVIEFGMVFVDMFCLVMMFVVFITLWRTYPLFNSIRKYYKRFSLGKINKAPTPEDHHGEAGVDEENVQNGNDLSKDAETDDDQTLEENVGSSAGGTNDIKTHLNWSGFTGKVRKVISIHFLMLFVDIPALPLCLFLILTGLRTSSLISDLLSGDFYVIFGVTVYVQLLFFFIDLFFVLLFLVLMVLKPIESWIQLLEDEEHKIYRLICYFIQWIPDIVANSVKVHENLEEILATKIKETDDVAVVHAALSNALSKQQSSISKLLSKLKKNEVEDEVIHLLEMVSYLESQRVGKLLRKFTLEKCFMLRADVRLHEENRAIWSNEMDVYEKECADYYQQLLRYKPERKPLYELKSGLSTRSRIETQAVLIHCLPYERFVVIAGAILCCLPLYRAPLMLKRLFKSWYNRVEIVQNTLKEYLYDLVALLRILIVVVFLYRAPFMMVDILDCVVEKRSWVAVRETVKRYPPEIFEDFLNMMSVLCSWKTPRFLICAILFGVLMPADIILGSLRKWTDNKCVAYLLTFVLYVIFVGSPLALSLYGANKLLEHSLGWSIEIVLCAFSLVLFVTLLMMVIVAGKDENKKFLLQMPECDYVRYNWYNMQVVVFEVVEFFQSLALVFKIRFIPMYGGRTLNVISSYLLFSFMPFLPVFWLTTAFFLIWFLICGAPIIMENILEQMPLGTCGKKKSWRFLVSLFTNTLFVTFVENLTSVAACQYNSCPRSNTSNITCNSVVFLEDPSWSCWVPPHTAYSAFGLLAFVWFVTTSSLFGTEYGDPESIEQDIGFSPIYNTVVNIFKAIMVVAVTFITTNSYISLAVLMFCNISLVFYTIGFRRIFKTAASNLPSLIVWRVFTFVTSLIASIAVLLAFVFADDASKLPLCIFGGGVVSSFIISCVVVWRLQRASDIVRDREEFREEIIRLKDYLVSNKWLLKKWKKQNKVWTRLVKTVREAKSHDKHVEKDGWKIAKLEETHIIEQQIKEDATAEGPAESVPPPPSYDAVEDDEVYEHITAVSALPWDYTVMKLEKNGQNLLLALEQSIIYEAYRYAFISQRNLWLNAVANSNWTGLLHCVRVLRRSVDGSYNKPTQLDVSLSGKSLPKDRLCDEPDDMSVKPPPFVRLTKEENRVRSDTLRLKALQDIRSHENAGEQWARLFDNLLPTIPIIKSWTFEDSYFVMCFHRSSCGTIVKVDEGGNKYAKGASVLLNKSLRGFIRENSVKFDDDAEPCGKKGPISVTIDTLTLVNKMDVCYLEAFGKKVKFDVALASFGELKWS